VAAVSRTTDLRDEEVLRRAGANLVFSGRVDPTLWDRRLELLLNVPRRRETRFPMLVDPWAGLGPTSDPRAAWSINISVRGVLVETGDPMDLGTKLDMRFTLPDDTDPVQAVGQVVREAGDMGERARSGVEFLILLGKARDRIAWFVDRTGEA
jgi:hypothetical protein